MIELHNKEQGMDGKNHSFFSFGWLTVHVVTHSGRARGLGTKPRRRRKRGRRMSPAEKTRRAAPSLRTSDPRSSPRPLVFWRICEPSVLRCFN